MNEIISEKINYYKNRMAQIERDRKNLYANIEYCASNQREARNIINFALDIEKLDKEWFVLHDAYISLKHVDD